MSATFESEDFAKYFKSFYNNQPIPAPIIFIEKSYSFNTQIFYVEQLKALTREVILFYLSITNQPTQKIIVDSSF